MFRRLPISKNIIAASSFLARRSAVATNKQQLALLTPMRFCSTSATNPVDVENWTLDEAIVKRHQEIQEKWVNLSSEFTRLKSENDNKGILSAVDQGLQLFDEVGANDSPVHCQQMLWMTKAQAHLNLKEFDASYENAKKAHDAYEKDANKSEGGEGALREVREFLGFVQLERGNYQEALEIFDEMLVWVAEGSRKALPMVQVLAVNMKRTLQTGKARALYGLATTAKKNDNEVDVRPRLDQSLDLLIESLSAHVDEKDVESAKMALDYATLCYCALGDYSKAEDACDKMEGWCRRHEDEAGLALAESRRKEIEALVAAKKN